jgi:hypothetical protein
MKKKRLLFIILFIFLLTEIVLRIFFPKELGLAGTPLVYQFDPVVHYTYIPNSKFKRQGKEIFINKQGFVGNDFSIADSSYFKIAIIGCSSVSGPNHLLEYYSFPPVIEEKLKDNGYSVQVFNCGMDGSGRSVQLLQSIPYQILAFDPNIILFELDLPLCNSNISREAYRGVNIFYPYDNADSREDVKKYVDGFLKYRGLIHFLHKSYLVRAAIKGYMKQEFQNFTTYYIRAYQSNCWHSWGNEQIPITIEESVRLIHEMKEDLLSKNVRFFLFQYGKNSEVIKFSKENGLPLISLGVNFSPDDYYHKDGHWNGNGCEKIAAKFSQLLIKYKLIPEEYYSAQKEK